MFKNERLQKRLTKSFVMVAAITMLSGIIGLIAMVVITFRYSYALENFGFAQGDIGKAMTYFADTRSALRATIGYSDPDIVALVLAQHEENKAAFEEAFAQVENTVVSADGRVTYDKIAGELDEYWSVDAEILKLGSSIYEEDTVKAQQKAVDELAPLYSEIYGDLSSLMDVKVEHGAQLSQTLMLLAVVLGIVIAVVVVVSMTVASTIGRGIAVSIARPIIQLCERLQTFSKGDFATPFPAVNTHDEIADMIKEASDMGANLRLLINDMGNVLNEMASGNYVVSSAMRDKYTGEFEQLIYAMRVMRDRMATTLRSIGDASNQVSAGSNNLAESSQTLAEGATEQAGAVEELQATFINITETMERFAQSAEESYKQAEKYANEADNSRAEMSAMVNAMERINETSKKIGNIISEIESIASQTNLLSLNASIEAARAGEAGRGFAVVADQIRQLAEQSAQSVVDTRELIEGSLQEISEGNYAAERAANSIELVVDGIKNIADASREQSRMAEEQAETMRQAEQGVSQISEVVQSNSATAQESSATSEELSAQATTLDELIGQFVLE
ncbi:methyl-accepting chemotaxis protein [Lachnospiraceae bacterium JLR.KK008]